MTEETVAQPYRILHSILHRDDTLAFRSVVPIEHSLDLYGSVRTFARRLEDKMLPPLGEWRSNMQPFQIADMRKFLPPMIAYLTAIQKEFEE